MKLINLLIISVIVLFSCKKDTVVLKTPEHLKKGMLVLNEGLFQQNNSTVSWVDLNTNEVVLDLFSSVNGRLLGDTGNDMKIYGGKIYIVVNNSGTIEVLNRNNLKSIKQINMTVGSINKSPRSIAFSGSKAYVACYDGYVDVIDTASLTILERIQVGANPEDLVVGNGKLYVSNSGGLNYPNVDSTVSVIDLMDYSQQIKLTVGKNPGGLQVDDEGDVYVIARGNYGSIPSRLVRIDGATNTVAETFSFNALGIERMGSSFLINYYDFNTQIASVSLFDPLTETIINPTLIPMDEITTLYGVKYDPFRNKIYCLDAMSFTNTGYLRRFSVDGTYETSIHVGLNPNNVLFYE